MKNKGYVLTMDAVIALIFVVGVFIAMLSLNFFNPDETSKTAFLSLHYVSEDTLDVLNKQGVLDEIGFEWSLDTPQSLARAENISKYYFSDMKIVPDNVGYRMEILEFNAESNETVTTNITNSDWYGTSRPSYSEATVITHSSRFLIGYGMNKPVLGSVARSFMVVGALDLGVNITDTLKCSNLQNPPWNLCDGLDACCVGNGCTATAKNPTDCDEVCYGINCTLHVDNNGKPGFHALCCGLGSDPCTISTGNNFMGDATAHSTTATCCGPGCVTNVGNNIHKGADMMCCGDDCFTGVYPDIHIQQGPNTIGCIGDNCTTEVISNTKKVEQTEVFCYGNGCSVTASGASSYSGSNVFCCGTGCTASCDTCPAQVNPAGKCPPSYDFCAPCDTYCDFSNNNPIFTYWVPYAEPAEKVKGSKNITIHIDTNRDNSPDINYTLDEWGSIPDDSFGFDPDTDAIDDALMRLLDDLNTYGDNDPAPTPLMNGTFRRELGDGGSLNPIDINNTNVILDAVQVENIRSLWGPVQFKLVVWM